MNSLEKIDILMLKTEIKQKLKKNKITNLKQLTNLKRKDFSKLDFNQYEIEQIEIKLQLEGLDLKR
ncbi:MAG: hypothetical protein HFJ53_03360 [Clostridia bacterium]|nr:hypothetical protein [Clostridia bacterium]